MRTWLKANPFIGTSILVGIIIGAVALLDYIINGRTPAIAGTQPDEPVERVKQDYLELRKVANGHTTMNSSSSPGTVSAGSTGRSHH